MAEPYTGISRGVGLQLMVRVRPVKPGQREDIKINGNHVTLLDVNNRVREEAEVFEVFPPRKSNADIYDTQLRLFLDSVMQGVNVGIFTFGATGTGKSYTLEGGKAELGIPANFVQGLFSAISSKAADYAAPERKEQGDTFGCSVRMQFVEIVDEEITDLLGKNSDSLSVKLDEWQGPTVVGAEWRPIANEQQFSGLYSEGIQNRTALVNEFGKLSDKAAAVLIVEMAQNSVIGGDTIVIVNRVIFIDLPGSEVLCQDAETLRIKQGNTLNQGILALQSVLEDLSGERRDLAMYEASNLTKLCREVFGGNSIGIAIFHLQQDDQIGSGVTLKFAKQCRQITNYPITNDNRSISLLRRYRLETNSLRRSMCGTGGDPSEKYQMKLDEMEKKMIGENLNTLQFSEEKQALGGRMQELREKYNALVKAKTEVQKALLQSEEEKVDLSKALLELQIQNAKLQEQVQNNQFEGQSKAVGGEADTLETQMRQEKAQKMITELQEELGRVIEDKKEFEIEFVALKKNFLNKTQELEEQKRKNEQISVELINMMNENKALTRGSNNDVVGQDHGTVHGEYERSAKRISQLEAENARLKEELIKISANADRAKNERIRAEIAAERTKTDYESKLVQLEKDSLIIGGGSQPQTNAKTVTPKPGQSREKKEEKETWEKERFSFQRRCRELNRKLEASVTDLEEVRLEAERLKTERNSLAGQLEEARNTIKENLVKMGAEAASSELIATYKDTEYQLRLEVESQTKRADSLQAKCKDLRGYSRELRALAEDVWPENEPKPSVLTRPEPVAQKDEKEWAKSPYKGGSSAGVPATSVEALKEENKRLKAEVQYLRQSIEDMKSVKGKGDDGAIQEKILNELMALKGDQKQVTRPGTASAEAESLRKERNHLLEENRKLKQIIDQDAAGPASGGNVKQMRQKIMYLENAIRDLEKERSELKVRATMAEQQLKTLQEHYNKANHDYQKKIVELRRQNGQ